MRDRTPEGTTVVARVWMDDRPGALGAVASRIGAVRGDVVGIQILERGAGRAVDDIVVDLPSPDLVPLLVKELNEVDGVDVAEVRLVADSALDPWLNATDTAAQLLGASDDDALLDTLVDHAHRIAGADWTIIVDLGTTVVVADRGDVPSATYLAAFVAGTRDAGRTGHAVVGGDTTWVPLPAAGLALVQSRARPSFRARERRQAAALARIADGWLAARARIRQEAVEEARSRFAGLAGLAEPPALP
jgi:hypothetical protein